MNHEICALAGASIHVQYAFPKRPGMRLSLLKTLPDTEPGSRYLTCTGFEIHVTEWGDRTLPPLLMWHGLARTGRDFDPVARALSDRFHILCPDQIGRGFSQWSGTPDKNYCLDFYSEVAKSLMDQLGLGKVDWLGTSMGGATGIRAAAGLLQGRIGRMVINDIGPTLPAPAVARIREYVGKPPSFVLSSEFEAYIRRIYRPFGYHTDAQWRHLAQSSMRRLQNGRITTHYDPDIVRQFENTPNDYEQWDAFDSLTLPMLVLRGVDSDLLLPEVASEMQRRGPQVKLVEVSACGHAPGLNTQDQIETITNFLLP